MSMRALRRSGGAQGMKPVGSQYLVVNESALALILAGVVCFLSVSYYDYFAHALNNDVWEAVNGFTRIVIPDTFVYKSIVNFSDFTGPSDLLLVKNAIGPSFIWFVADGNWFVASLINSAFLCLALIYFGRLAIFLGVSRRRSIKLMAIIGLLPATIYYSVGALKEIPSLLFLTAFFYHYIKGDRVRWVFYAVFCALLRYQLAFPLLMFLSADQFRGRSLRYAFFALVVISAIYPFIQFLEVLSADATYSYRDLYGSAGSMGGFVESVRETMPGVSAIAVLLRVVQSIFEPLLAFYRSPSLYELGEFSVLQAAYVSSAFILLPAWLSYLRRTGLLLLRRENSSPQVRQLYLFCLVFIVPIGGFSFVHHRYLYPMMALVLLAGAVRLEPRIALQADRGDYRSAVA